MVTAYEIQQIGSGGFQRVSSGPWRIGILHRPFGLADFPECHAVGTQFLRPGTDDCCQHPGKPRRKVLNNPRKADCGYPDCPNRRTKHERRQTERVPKTVCARTAHRAPAVRREGAIAIGATAVGALALGAVAMGALAIGQLAIGQLGLGRVRCVGDKWTTWKSPG